MFSGIASNKTVSLLSPLCVLCNHSTGYGLTDNLQEINHCSFKINFLCAKIFGYFFFHNVLKRLQGCRGTDISKSDVYLVEV